MVSKEIAKEELKKWAEYKRIPAHKLNDETNNRIAEEIVAEIESGDLVLTDNFEWEYNLKFPIEIANTKVSQLKFKPRISQGRLDAAYKKLDMKDFGGKFVATIAVLTEQPESTIKCLDTVDASLCNAIASYFF